jgi:hypothetical protein
VGTAGTGAQDIIFTPPVRVTAVRDSKATANANQVDISVAVSTGSATAKDVVFAGGAREAVSHVIRLEPLNNTTGSKANYAVGVAVLDGKEVKGAANGLNNIDVTALTYTSVGTYNFDADSFLSLARNPRVNPA